MLDREDLVKKRMVYEPRKAEDSPKSEGYFEISSFA